MNWLGRKPTEQDQAEERPLGFDDYDLRLGDVMRGERATLGKSLLDVQRELHIRATYIAAIENADLSAFEAPSFVAGYVRSYAKYLGLDPEWAYARFCAETNFSVSKLMVGPRKDPAEARPVDRSAPEGLLTRISARPAREPIWQRIEPSALGSIAVLVVLIAGLGYGGWAVLHEVQRVQLAPVDQAPEVLANLDPLESVPALSEVRGDEGYALSLAPPRSNSATGGSGAEGTVRVYRPQGLDLPVMESRDGPIAAINPRLPANGRTDVAADPVALALAEALSAEDPGAGTIQVSEQAPPSVELLAVRPSWVRVRAADGTVLFEKILDAGERFTVPQTEEPPNLRAGNSGAVYFLVNGTAYGPAAPGAQVVSNVILSPEALRERMQVADLGRDADLERFVDFAEVNDE